MQHFLLEMLHFDLDRGLMIAESPNDTEKIKTILDRDVAAAACHFRDLPPNELGVSAQFVI